MMIYHQIRNATCVLELGGKRILIDPMLGDPGTLPPYTVIRFKARWNPLTPLPENWEQTLQDVDACLISHTHFGVDCDHLDNAGAAWLEAHAIPTYGRSGDHGRLSKRGLVVTDVGEEPQPFYDGTIRTVPAAHGRGMVGVMMGQGVGYLIEFPEEPLVYVTGDTVLTNSVKEVLKTHQPGVCIVPAGGARLDVGGPILMDVDELASFVAASPGKIIMNHIGALNHCPQTPEAILAKLKQDEKSKILFPADGESVRLD